MHRVEVALPHHRYDVVIQPGLLEGLGEWVRQLAPHDRAAVMGDRTPMQIHGGRAAESMRQAGYDAIEVPIECGEEHKTLQTVSKLYGHMVGHQLERKSPVISLGGGVSGDTVGFAAATYLRGVPFIQCPTTLLAMVDASVGGKVGVNIPEGKNLVGAFYQPHAVAIDPVTLQTLPPRELRCGLAECVKHGMIRDSSLFNYLKANLAKIQAIDLDTVSELVRRNVQIKAAVVMADEKESGERAHLNFGHTFAHAIEANAGYGVIGHGEAVSLGMVAATHLAESIGLCETGLKPKLIDLLAAIGLPTRSALPENSQLIQTMRLDKKVADNRIRFVLPEAMGRVTIRNDIADDQVAQAWDSIRS